MTGQAAAPAAATSCEKSLFSVLTVLPQLTASTLEQETVQIVSVKKEIGQIVSVRQRLNRGEQVCTGV